MNVVYSFDGTVKSLEHLNKIRTWMEDEASRQYHFKYKTTRIANVSYIPEQDIYSFTMEFLSA